MQRCGGAGEFQMIPFLTASGSVYQTHQPWVQRLKLKYDEPLANNVFNFFVRLCTKAGSTQAYVYGLAGALPDRGMVGDLLKDVQDLMLKHV